MAKNTSTEVGDVLILRTSRTYTVYAVGRVSQAGQRDFSGRSTASHVNTLGDAIQAAHAIVTPGRRIHLLNIDTEGWAEILS